LLGEADEAIWGSSTRLVSLAAQKFVAGIAEEAHWYAEQRQQATTKSKVEAGYDVRDKRKVLTTEDLAAAMKEVCTLALSACPHRSRVQRFPDNVDATAELGVHMACHARCSVYRDHSGNLETSNRL
jgi:hypothetical protein